MAIIACLLWSTAFVGIKIGLQYSTPLQFAGLRFFIAGILILPFIKDFKNKFKIAKNKFNIILWVALLQTTLLYAFFYLGLNKVPASLASMLVGSSPLFVAMIANFMISNDKMTRYKSFYIILGLIGVAIISITKGGNDSSNYPHILLGIFILFLNNITAGFGNVVVAKYGNGIPPMLLSSFSLIIGGAILFIVSLFVEGFSFSYAILPIQYYLSLAWLSFLSAASITIWYTLLRRKGVKVSDLNMWKFIIPVFGACLSWIIIKQEKPTFIAIVGMIIIALSLILMNLKYKIKKSRILK